MSTDSPQQMTMANSSNAALITVEQRNLSETSPDEFQFRPSSVPLKLHERMCVKNYLNHLIIGEPALIICWCLDSLAYVCCLRLLDQGHMTNIDLRAQITNSQDCNFQLVAHSSLQLAFITLACNHGHCDYCPFLLASLTIL